MFCLILSSFSDFGTVEMPRCTRQLINTCPTVTSYFFAISKSESSVKNGAGRSLVDWPRDEYAVMWIHFFSQYTARSNCGRHGLIWTWLTAGTTAVLSSRISKFLIEKFDAPMDLHLPVYKYMILHKRRYTCAAPRTCIKQPHHFESSPRMLDFRLVRSLSLLCQMFEANA